jgi:hypothetical protein
MFRLFTSDPVAIVTMALCLATIAVVARLMRRFQHTRIRFLLGVLGVLCIHQGLRMIQERTDLLAVHFAYLADIADLAVIALCLAAVLTVGLLSREHNQARFQLRLSEADQPPLPRPRYADQTASSAS